MKTVFVGTFLFVLLGLVYLSALGLMHR